MSVVAAIPGRPPGTDPKSASELDSITRFKVVILGLCVTQFMVAATDAQNLIPRVFNTGVDDTGALLTSYMVDPHYTLLSSADPKYPGPAAIVVDDSLRPIVSGEWTSNTTVSKWIGPQGNQDWADNPSAGDPVGNYTYRTTFDLTGYDPDQVTLYGQWTCETLGTAVLINGATTSNSTITNIYQVHLEWSPLLITNGFVAGTNKLDFVVNRVAYVWPNLPTGLQVQLTLSNVPPQLQIGLSGEDVLVWWPTNHSSGYFLETSARLGNDQSWSAFPGTVRVVGDQNAVVADTSAGSQFFRLRKTVP